MKADVFSAAATLFLINLKCAPFRRAHLKDPYYKRLYKDKRAFWKIYQSLPSSKQFKDLFEQMTCFDPQKRLSPENILEHEYLSEVKDLVKHAYTQKDGNETDDPDFE